MIKDIIYIKPSTEFNIPLIIRDWGYFLDTYVDMITESYTIKSNKIYKLTLSDDKEYMNIYVDKRRKFYKTSISMEFLNINKHIFVDVTKQVERSKKLKELIKSFDN